MRKFMAVLIASWLLQIAAAAQAETTMHQGAEYITDDPQITLVWNAVEDADGYQIKLIMTDRVPVTEYARGETRQTQMTVKRPRAGHFDGAVRAYKDGFVCTNAEGEKIICNPDGAGHLDHCETEFTGCAQGRLYSDWTLSTDKERATVNGEPMGWWIYWKVPKPGCVIVE